MKKLSSNSLFEKQAGYSRMIGNDDWVLSAGTTGFDYQNMTIDKELEKQVLKTIKNIEEYLAEYDCTLKDVIQCNWIITKRKYFKVTGEILKQYFFKSKPVMMTTVCKLIDKRMKFEMQIIAKKSS